MVKSGTTSSAVVTVPPMVWTSLKLVTTPGVPTDIPLASHTRNLAGTVLFCLKTLEPSALIGCRIWWPISPRQTPVSA